MSTLVEISGFQYEVENNSKIEVPLQDGKEGDTLEFDKVLMNEDNGNVTLGSPYIKGANVKAKIVGHGKDKKILVFHKKRRKGYQKLNGHRQNYTTLEITDIKV